MAERGGIQITLEYGVPRRLDDESWELHAWATATEGRNRDPLHGEVIEFVNEGDPEADHETGPSGKTEQHTFHAPKGATGIVIEARLKRDPRRSDKKTVVLVREQKPKKPKDIQCFESYEGDRGTLIFRVIDEDGSPMKEETIIVHDEEHRPVVYPVDRKTNENGMVTVSITMESSHKSIVVMLRDFQKLIHLYK